jgi:hypothetical protein
MLQVGAIRIEEEKEKEEGGGGGDRSTHCSYDRHCT